eukprot:NODE_4789_length_761_cov_5.435393_g4441_i0.p1 GENE.NODE_4789_length_761_cov_5.435393_g4441_i0~~NODE_4789_length_761_cov_5.435393_g4441_i0.p1  ORF type:complete len:111 (+),score=20.20 NODE_4789_length_761_cov_5.435393_g4441_i0:154-486(+)
MENKRTAWNLTREEFDRCSEAFHRNAVSSDRSETGFSTLTIWQLQTAMLELGQPVSAEYLQKICGAIDDSGSGRIAFDEFINIMQIEKHKELSPIPSGNEIWHRYGQRAA